MTAPTATLVAIVRDEGPYLIEWIAYHRLIGFDRLLIYSNHSSDGSDAMLDRLAAHGIVDHRRWADAEGQSAQVSAYRDSLARIATEWVAFLDADEFLLLRQDASVGAFLGRFGTDVSAVALNWRLFGSGGQDEAGPEPVTHRFTRASPRGHHNNRHSKVIARVADIQDPAVHRVHLARGRYVDTTGAETALERNAFTPTVEHGIAQVNHYVVKSRAEYAAKVRRGNAHLPPEAPNKYSNRGPNFFAQHDLNDDEDRTILRHAPALARAMADLEALARPAAA